MFEIDKHKFGAFVAKLRKEKGYTQKELAEQLFISDKAISKWETGASIPDTALLIPLAEILGVSVTELLLCERMAQTETMDSDKVEDIVKTAIAYSEEKPSRAYRGKGMWIMLYLLSLALGISGLYACYQVSPAAPQVQAPVLLGAILGAYFCFFARLKLPAYYDQNKINGMHDGPIRMNIPGLSFNNANWPHIILVGRIWSCTAMGLYPIFAALMLYFFADVWERMELYTYLLMFLGGLFLPVYIVGKKYE